MAEEGTDMLQLDPGAGGTVASNQKGGVDGLPLASECEDSQDLRKRVDMLGHPKGLWAFSQEEASQCWPQEKSLLALHRHIH